MVAVNDTRKRAMGRKIIAAMAAAGIDEPRGKKVALLGLTFKPNTDDMRDAPSLAIAQALMDAGAEVVATDPEGMKSAQELLPGVTMVGNAYAAIAGAHAVVLVTEWDAFRALDLKRVAREAAVPLLVDLRNVYNPVEARAAGLTYVSVGRG